MPAMENEEVKYLRRRLKYLRDCNAEIENRLRDDGDEFIKNCDDDGACNEYLWHIEITMRSTFRYAMFIAVCTFLEESVKFVCSRALPDYGKNLQSYHRGNWLSKHRRLLEDDAQVDLAAIKGHLDTMEEFVKVRNCIAHDWGKIDEKDGQLVKIIERKRQDDCFGRWADGFLRLTDQAVPTAFIESGRIINKLLEDLFGLPGHCVY